MQIFLHIFDMDVKVPALIPNVTPFFAGIYLEGMNPFLSLSQGTFGKKPFLEFLKAFPDLKVIGKTFPATLNTFPSR
jgi:hypothetical protein